MEKEVVSTRRAKVMKDDFLNAQTDPEVATSVDAASPEPNPPPQTVTIRRLRAAEEYPSSTSDQVTQKEDEREQKKKIVCIATDSRGQLGP